MIRNIAICLKSLASNRHSRLVRIQVWYGMVNLATVFKMTKINPNILATKISIFLQATCFLLNLSSVFTGKINLDSNFELLKEAGCNPSGTLIVRGICVNSDYDDGEAPDQSSTPVWTRSVSVQFSDQEVLEVEEEQNRVILDTQLNFFWRDDRIKTNSTFLSSNSRISSYAVGRLIHWHEKSAWFDTIWTPTSIFFENVNDKKLKYKPATVLLVASGETLGKKPQFPSEDLPPTATFISVVKDYTLGLKCSFDFSLFPFDKHVCRFRLTNKYAGDFEISLNTWQMTEISMNTWQLKDTAKKKDSRNEYFKDGFDISVSYTEGNESIETNIGYVEMTLEMERVVYPFLCNYYIPSCAIVCISHISFIIPPSSIPGRLGLLSTQFLTLTNIFIDGNVRTALTQNILKICFIKTFTKSNIINFIFYSLTAQLEQK